MIAYIDASVIIRLVFNEPYPLAEWSQIDEGITSQLTRLECARIDSIHLASASAYRRALGPPQVIAFATHDRELAEAAKSLGFPVIGTSLP